MPEASTPPVRKLRRHIFVCTNERPAGHPRGCCKTKGSEELVALFKAALSKAGAKGEVRAQKAGCLDVCEWGPTVVVYPEGVWYGKVQASDVDEIIASHILGDKPVKRLQIPGK
jgi:(2Fe-2S) ferredoxin